MGEEAMAQHEGRINSNGIVKRVIISHLDGTLLRSTSFFPYYMLMSLEAGSPLRSLVLLLLYPLTWLLSFVSETLPIRIQIFVSIAGLKQAEVIAVSKAVLPKFFLEDLARGPYRALLQGGTDKYVVTSHPRIFVEHFVRHHLGVKRVFATEVEVTRGGFCTGRVNAKSGVLDESGKLMLVKQAFQETRGQPSIGLCNSAHKHTFLSCCQDVISMPIRSHDTVPKEEYVNPLVFHDGRLVMRPTPFVSLAIFLWMPAGIFLFLIRNMIGICLPKELSFPLISLFGLKVRVKGAPPLLQRELASNWETENISQEGAIFVCTHRTLADPIFLSIALRRKVRAMAYSISKVSEYMSPIPATRLTRNREKDARIIDELLHKEDVFICPEGTTCREPFLLRFSPMFADMTNNVVPVALNVKMSMFQGTSVRGYKALDGIFYCLNPRPSYEVIFLEPLPMDKLRAEGKSAIEIANMTQRLLADKLGFQCTNYNRKDKYNMLAGNDGIF